MELVMFCGIPTSGKSTYVKKLKKMDYWHNAVVLSTDDYIEKVAEENGKTYNEVFKSTIDEATHHLEFSLKDAIANNKDIFWDQTNLSVKTRKQKLSNIPLQYRKGAVYFEVSLEEALERNKNRAGKTIPENTLKQMHSSFVIPTIEEGFGYVWRN